MQPPSNCNILILWRAEMRVNRFKQAKQIHWFHWVIILLSLLLTIFAWKVAKDQADEKIRVKYERKAKQVVELLKERMQKYEDALWSGVALIKTYNDDVDYKTWLQFADSLNIYKKYPGINGIGVIFSVKKENLSEYLAQQRVDRKNFSIYPKHQNPDLFPITYIEPVKLNKKAVGLDMAHEQNRYQAALKARDTGEAQITGPIVLVQDKNKTPGFLFYAPFYKEQKNKSLTERQKNFVGMVYAPFVVNKLMRGTLSKQKRHIGIRITDAKEVLYDEHNSSHDEFDPKPMFKSEHSVDIYGRTWSFDIRTTKDFTTAYKTNTPIIILLGGIFIDCLLFLLFLLMSRSNQKAYSYAQKMHEEAEAQRAMALNSNKLVALGEMAGGVAHEINNPLAIISVHNLQLKTFLKSQNFDEALKSSDKIDATVARISKIVKSMKELTRNTSQDEYEEFFIKDVVDDCLSLCSEKLQKNGIKLVIKDIDPSLKIKGQKIQLSQVLINLINNAYDAINKTQAPWIEVQVKKVNQNVMISIKDSGQGIPEHLQEKILNPFFTTKDVGEGTGLGLSISKTIIEQHKGRLVLDSMSENTCFNIFIPINSKKAEYGESA